MFYYEFKESVTQLIISMEKLLICSGANVDNHLRHVYVAAYRFFESKLSELKKVNKLLPDEIPGYPDKNYGPVVCIYDVHELLSFLFPIVKKIDSDFPLLSSAPIMLFKEKSLIIVEVMNLYFEWRLDLYNGPISEDDERALPSFTKETLVLYEDFIAHDSACFEMLFENLGSSIEQAKQGIGRKFDVDYEQV